MLRGGDTDIDKEILGERPEGSEGINCDILGGKAFLTEGIVSVKFLRWELAHTCSGSARKGGGKWQEIRSETCSPLFQRVNQITMAY